MNILIIKDEAISGKLLHEISLKFENQYITVKELIAKRIQKEVERYQNDLTSYSTNCLVLPNDFEKRLKNKSPKRVDIEKQVYVALEAFKNNGFFILIDDEQVDQLDQKFLIDEQTHVSFIKLTPLVGG